MGLTGKISNGVAVAGEETIDGLSCEVLGFILTFIIFLCVCSGLSNAILLIEFDFSKLVTSELIVYVSNRNDIGGTGVFLENFFVAHLGLENSSSLPLFSK